MRLKPTACYIRVSTQEQKLHGISLDAQREKLSEYAKTHHLKIVEWYADEGVSGKKPIAKRPALQQMIADAEQGRFEHIIFIKLDRFFRSVAEYHECMKRLGDVTWDATEEKYDISTANGRAFVNMKLTIAELEADQTGERIKLVNDYKVKTGQPLHGSMPWSHKIVNTEDGKRIIADPDTKEDCIRVLDYFLNTGSMRATLRYADQYHSFYDLVGLKRWLMNPMLYGSYRGNDNYCEPIISREKFDKIQAQIKTYTPKRKNIYLFSGLIPCPVCGKSMTGYTAVQKHKGKEYRYKKYKCDQYHRKVGCTYNKHLSENLVEKCLLEQLDNFLEEEATPKYRLKKRKGRDEKVIKAEMDRLNYMFQKNRISVGDYDDRYSALQKELSSLPNGNETEDLRKLKEIQALIDQGWKVAYAELDDEHKRQVWHSVIKEMHIRKDGRAYTLLDVILL